LLLIKAVGSARQGDWLWLGLAALCGVLILIWPDVNPRYLVPVAPLLAMAVLSPLITASGGKGALASWSRVLVWIFVISVAVTNLSLWGISVYVARHRDFYGLYEAGMDQDLIDIGYYLGRVGASNREIGVSGRYKNGPHIRHPRFLMRALVVLTENHVASIPVAAENDIRLPPGQSVLDWAHKSSVRYYACLPPVSPWRVWHFRIPWIQKMVTHHSVIPTRDSFQLWDVSGDAAVQIHVERVNDWPLRVPGM